MAKIFRTNILSLSGKDISVNPADTNTFLRHDGTFSAVNTGNFISASQTGQFYPLSNPSNFANSGNLAATGSALDNKINLITGGTGAFYYNTNPAQFTTSGNLALTGSNLQNQINLITGGTGAFYYSSNPARFVTSGDLYSTGNILDTKINSVSGNLTQTGVNLISYVNTNSATITNLFTTGSNLFSRFVDISGNLTSSGVTLINLINGLSGQININLGSTGSNLLNRITNDSGNLTSTGIYLINLINGLSGQSNLNYATIANLASTGTTIYNHANNISGNLTATGAGLYNYISSLSGNLRATGQTLDNKINSLSGWIANNPSGFITSSQTGGFGGGGSQADALNLSGNLYLTGKNLNDKIVSLSGFATGRFLTGLIGGTNVTVSNNLDGTYTINSTASGSGPGTAGGGVTGIGINNGTGITGFVNFMPVNNIGLTQSGNNIYVDSNVTGVGDLYFPTNAGMVSAFEFPIATGATSGTIESYSFNINYTPIATIYSEYNNFTGVQNNSFIINEGFGLTPSGLGLSTTLGTKPFYIYTGLSVATINLPAIDFCTGRMYFIKNRGATLTVTGNRLTDRFYTTQVAKSLTINSGEAYILCNDGNYWEVM